VQTKGKAAKNERRVVVCCGECISQRFTGSARANAEQGTAGKQNQMLLLIELFWPLLLFFRIEP